MRFIGIIIIFAAVLTSCKKKDKDSDSNLVSTPEKPNGTLNIAISSYDSLGYVDAKVTNTSVHLSGTSYSANPDTTGFVSFSLPEGNYFPSMIRTNYDGSPFMAHVTSGSTTNASAILARNSPFALQITAAQSVNPDSVTLSMSLDKAIPAGKQVKIAVIFSSTLPVSVNSYSVYEEFYFTQASNPGFNVCKGAIKSALAALPSGASSPKPYYLLAVPVTYGNYYSSFLGTNVLLGDHLPTSGAPTATIGLSKTW